jgi:hypothetical protein|tara:strand:- start:14341 stop:14553 length:213 start_codon:yes stop_codon:yes gene_type:complete
MECDIMVKNILIRHREAITIVGACVGVISIGYGTYRMVRAEDRSIMERLEAVAVIGGGFFLTIAAIHNLK